MLNRYLVPSCLVGIAMLTVVIPTLAPKIVQPIASVQAAETSPELQPKEIAAIAKATVVRIEASNGVAGSGVISSVYQEGGKNVYVVLTAKNLVQDKNVKYNIITPVPQDSKEGRRLQITISADKDIEELPDGNLAIVRFRTYHTYQTAQLIGSDEADRTGLYVAGFPNLPQGNNKRVFHATQFRKKDKSQTYSDLSADYNFAGVIGGPVFDGSGRVMNIYGTTNNQQKAIGKRRGFSFLRNYPKLRIRLSSTPPLLTLSLRDPIPLNVTEEIKPTDIDVVNE